MNNYSYVTYLTDDTYTYGIVLLVESMKQVYTKYPLHVLVTNEVSVPCLKILDQLGVTYELVDVIPMSEQISEYNNILAPDLAVTWKNCWTQFRVFNLTKFDKIVFFDADIMLLKNMDHLFEKPHMTACLDGEYFNIWPDCPHFNTGCMVIEPSHKEFEDILEFANNFDPKDHWREEPVANQEILNHYFKDWVNKKELHLDKYYDIFAPYVHDEDLFDLEFKTQFIHFVGRKPWMFWVNNPEEDYNETYYYQAKDIIQKGINNIDWETIHKNIIVTVYGICKNEIKSIENYLKSFGIADYICILDTGSTDGTWEYLQEAQKKYPNLIIEQEIINPWRFDTARNRNMEMIPKETNIYFMADMDEIIKEDDWVDKVRNAWSPIFSRGVYTYNREVDENDVVQKQSVEYRIHSKIWKKWINLVHEAITNEHGTKYFYSESATPIDITVWHYPTKTGFTNYMVLCEQAVKEDPTDWVMHLQLAIEYEIRKKWEDAYKVYDFLIHQQTNFQTYELSRCYCGIGQYYEEMGYLDLAFHYYMEGRIIDPLFADNYIAAAGLYNDIQDYYRSIELCKQALENCKTTEWCSICDIHSFFPYFLLGMNYYSIGELEKALGNMTVAYYKNPVEDLQQIQLDIIQDIENKRMQKKEV